MEELESQELAAALTLAERLGQRQRQQVHGLIALALQGIPALLPQELVGRRQLLPGQLLPSVFNKLLLSSTPNQLLHTIEILRILLSKQKALSNQDQTTRAKDKHVMRQRFPLQYLRIAVH